MDTNLAPPRRFLQGHNLGRELVYTGLVFMKPNDLVLTSKGVCVVVKKLVSREVQPGSQKQPFYQGVIVNLDQSLREVYTTPRYICQPAVRSLVGNLAFVEEPLDIQHSN